MKTLALFLAALVASFPCRAQTENSRLLFTQIEPILQGLSDITGWKIKRKVPADYITKAKLEDFIQRRIRDQVKPEQVRIESETLKMFGFLPDDYDLKKAVVDLMTEQAAAFYDYDRKRLFITESDSSFLEKRAALVHELAHALADQNFPLGKYIRKGSKNDDDSTAREAVVEGQATWLMWAYVSKLGGGEAKVSEIILDQMSGSASDVVGSQYPVFEKAPLYLRESLIFPYTGGLAFTNAVVEKLGKQGFSEVFRRPPMSTRQIIHPDRYLARELPVATEAPAPPEKKHYRLRAEGAVGELDFRVLLEQYAGSSEARAIAPHWRGGSYRFYEARAGGAPLLTFVAEWDSPESATRFFEAYKKVIAKKWKNVEATATGTARYSGTGSRGAFAISVDGTRVTSLEGLPKPR